MVINLVKVMLPNITNGQYFIHGCIKNVGLGGMLRSSCNTGQVWQVALKLNHLSCYLVMPQGSHPELTVSVVHHY